MSNETQWTPGPWCTEFEQEEEFEGEPDPTYGKLTVESEFGCVALIGPLGPVKDDEDRANARLIAAAPEMFALLERMTNAAERRLRELRALNSIDALQLTNDIADARALLAKVNDA